MTTELIADAATVQTRAATRPSVARLAVVELRKLLDTRAGRWLLVTIGLACGVIAGVQLAVLDAPVQTFQTFFLGTLIPIGLLLPVLGILAVTSEWSQRTALSTFALVPQRHRVLAAKLLAGAAAAIASVAASVVIAALANLAALATGGAGDWRLDLAVLGNTVVFQLINVAMGLAFGMAALNTPLAIVAYFVLPTVWNVLGAMVGWLADAARWLDFTLTMEPMLNGATLTAGQWAQLGTTTAVWVLLPMAVGAVRVLRTEVG
ncbi:ABC transporter permease subunit [Natronosporangium hydrolyticum]|uniref:ABC transporter permease subunit n=1 Tax=Natronosporangium hydrolyticum TaxID=2811111 RepID=A0A895Y8I7_9ACTN|nr:ABC transporter permease [Natronosporangium hydrolyticum]QSB12615.1 ABC transporter permease subunit [Natronosporangium hydrolyticum]